MTTTTFFKDDSILNAKEIVAYYTFAAMGTGAIPVPAASAAIIAENGIMIAHIASTLGVKITVENVVASIGTAGTMNLVGRNLFVEGAKLLSWGTGSFWAAGALMALGASTAGIQTYIIGMIAIEIAKNNGIPLEKKYSNTLIKKAKDGGFDDFKEEWKEKKPKSPKKPKKPSQDNNDDYWV
jgi:hypothetical protein